ncbi:MAG TPA: HAMP domain-containing sensor histidine kinase [Mycobacteriales bacterium]|nr:HAMP domain-containing sensor histidine kinase [Mycobacteriales bacterium]
MSEDRTASYVDGLRRLTALSAGLLGTPPDVAGVLATVAATASDLCAADHAEVVLDDVVVPGDPGPDGPCLTVPVPLEGAGRAEITVANAPGGRTFDDHDTALLTDLAAYAAVALGWAAEAVRRSELTDAARHDLRSPLAAAKGYAQLLRQQGAELEPEQTERSWIGLLESLDRISGFIGRVLIDERIAVTGVRPAWTEVAVRPLLDRILGDHDLAATRRGIRIQIVGGPDAPDTCAAEPELIREALDNLVGNAVTYTADDTTVTVRVVRSRGFARFEVHNPGEPIPASDQDRIFERYARSASSDHRGVPGLGLGLSITRRIAIGHGGSVGVSSRGEDGTTFWATFPLTARSGDA